MIYNTIMELYRKFRLISYKDMFRKIQEKDGSLSATEAFSADVIHLLREPTVTRFAEYIGISQPNATYKVNNLVSKGYVKKAAGENDRRECYLQITDKFRGYFRENDQMLEKAFQTVESRFSGKELEAAERVLSALLNAIKEPQGF
jgi:DNA-binding MarR family transcriptional regulator